MKKIIALALAVLSVVGLCACAYDYRGHEVYDSMINYDDAFELEGIRYVEYARELFPDDTEDFKVEDFYFEWELGMIGDADVEMCLSVNYGAEYYEEEIERLKEIGEGDVKYDAESFKYPAYVSVLGYDGASWYALLDAENFTVHYVLLQLMDEDRIDISKEFLPKEYYDFGYVKGQSYNIYEKLFETTSEA